MRDDDAAIDEIREEEDIVVAAAKHVEMAKSQRQMFNLKKERAKEDRRKNTKRELRTYTFVADFAQNMCLPNFAAEQPGATYYYSPLNVYPFGIVDCSTEPAELTSYVFYEGWSIACVRLR